MSIYYTDEKNVQIVLAALKAHGLRRIVVSPGGTNPTFVLSVQQDPFFTLYSCVDERSAAYMACGIAEESGEPVALSCTGATAARNYLPALTEAFYRKLPILAITSSRTVVQVGQLIDQQTDRTCPPKDTVKLSLSLPYIKDDEDFWECELKINNAILELTHHGSGPVHVNLPTRYTRGYTCTELPKIRKIERFMYGDRLPKLPEGKTIGIYIGAHTPMNDDLTASIDIFCEKNNAAVFVDHNSGYHGKYGIYFLVASSQQQAFFTPYRPDIAIDLGEIAVLGRMQGAEMWRVSEDGQLRDPYKKLHYVFEMKERDFFDYYCKGERRETAYFKKVTDYVEKIRSEVLSLDFPLSNIYAAQQLSPLIPENAEIQLGILNSARSWNFFKIPGGCDSFTNTGGYGIDGGLSSFLGASFVHPEKLFFGVFGDLCFFYDMNALGNRQISRNVRVLLVNNGLGAEFKLYEIGRGEINKYVAAEGHFGHKSSTLVKHYAEDLGFEYMCASSKEEFQQVYKRFATPELTERPLFFELFTNEKDENEALERLLNVHVTAAGTAKKAAKKILGEKGTQVVKKILKK